MLGAVTAKAAPSSDVTKDVVVWCPTTSTSVNHQYVNIQQESTTEVETEILLHDRVALTPRWSSGGRKYILISPRKWRARAREKHRAGHRCVNSLNSLLKWLQVLTPFKKRPPFSTYNKILRGFSVTSSRAGWVTGRRAAPQQRLNNIKNQPESHELTSTKSSSTIIMYEVRPCDITAQAVLLVRQVGQRAPCRCADTSGFRSLHQNESEVKCQTITQNEVRSE